MSEPTKVLIVSEDIPTATWWTGILEDEGFQTAWCGGPNLTARCPALDGRRCDVRQWADVAVLDVAAEQTTELFGGTPERMCRRIPNHGGTVWVQVANAGRPSLRHPSAAGVLLTAVQAVTAAPGSEVEPCQAG